MIPEAQRRLLEYNHVSGWLPNPLSKVFWDSTFPLLDNLDCWFGPGGGDCTGHLACGLGFQPPNHHQSKLQVPNSSTLVLGLKYADHWGKTTNMNEVTCRPSRKISPQSMIALRQVSHPRRAHEATVRLPSTDQDEPGEVPSVAFCSPAESLTFSGLMENGETTVTLKLTAKSRGPCASFRRRQKIESHLPSRCLENKTRLVLVALVSGRSPPGPKTKKERFSAKSVRNSPPNQKKRELQIVVNPIPWLPAQPGCNEHPGFEPC